MTDWKEYTWGDLIALQRGHDLTVADIEEGEYPVCGSNGIIGYHQNFTTKGPTITLGRSGNSIGAAHYYQNDIWAHNTTLYIKEFKNCDPKFIFYLLKTIDFKSLNSGSAIPSLNRNYVYPKKVTVPTKKTVQTAIAEILSSLDDKIELNNQINRELEALAQALFKQWFVDFEFPDAEGVPYKSSGGEMVESSLGEIPLGWRVGEIGDIALNYKSSVSPNDIEPTTPYIGLEHIPKKSLSLSEWGVASDVDSQKSAYKKYDILFGKLRPYFHKVAVAPTDGICSTDILVIRPKNNDYFGFLLLHIFSNELVEYTSQVSGGTRMPRVNWSDIKKFAIILPHESTIENFDSTVNLFAENIIENIEENKHLISLRDALLPKLISGEVQVSEL